MCNIRLERTNINRFRFLVFTIAVVVGFALVQQAALAAPNTKLIEFWDDSEEESGLRVDHSAWDFLLKKYVTESPATEVNRFDYDAVTDADREALDSYVEYLQSLDPRQLPKIKQKAFWMNLYNAEVVRQVLRSSPIDSVLELGSQLWKRKRLKVTLQKMSLDNIEHGVLRPIFDDPRIHFSLATGALGGPNILPQAYTGDNVDYLIEHNTRAFLAHSRGASMQGNRLVLSTMFKGHQEDFGSVKKFIFPYVTEAVSGVLKDMTSARYVYDWRLNKPD